MGGHLPKHLAARESSKRLVSAEYIRFFEHLDSGVRTVGGADLIVLNESIVHERLNNLLYRLGHCETSGKSKVIPELFRGSLAPMPFIFGPSFSSSLSLNGKQ